MSQFLLYKKSDLQTSVNLFYAFFQPDSNHISKSTAKSNLTCLKKINMINPFGQSHFFLYIMLWSMRVEFNQTLLYAIVLTFQLFSLRLHHTHTQSIKKES